MLEQVLVSIVLYLVKTELQVFEFDHAFVRIAIVHIAIYGCCSLFFEIFVYDVLGYLKLPPKDEKGKKTFQKGQTDEVSVSAVDVGDIRKIRIGHGKLLEFDIFLT